MKTHFLSSSILIAVLALAFSVRSDAATVSATALIHASADDGNAALTTSAGVLLPGNDFVGANGFEGALVRLVGLNLTPVNLAAMQNATNPAQLEAAVAVALTVEYGFGNGTEAGLGQVPTGGGLHVNNFFVTGEFQGSINSPSGSGSATPIVDSLYWLAYDGPNKLAATEWGLFTSVGGSNPWNVVDHTSGLASEPTNSFDIDTVLHGALVDTDMADSQPFDQVRLGGFVPEPSGALLLLVSGVGLTLSHCRRRRA